MHPYTKRWGIFRNREIRQEIASLDPVTGHSRIVHLMAAYEFPVDMIRATEVALIRMFCSPSISVLLNRTGEFRCHSQKRYDDTGLLMAEFMLDGYDGERGRRALDHINMIHSYYNISEADYLFVLSTFVFIPAKWIEQYGWRGITEKERQALFYFFMEVGKRLHLKVPATLEELEAFVSDYERGSVHFHLANRVLGDATIGIVQSWLPAFAKRLVPPVIRCFLDTGTLEALGYTAPPAWVKICVRIFMKTRALALRWISFKKYPVYFTREPNRSYPEGYEIEQLGPDHIIRHARKAGSVPARSQSAIH